MDILKLRTFYHVAKLGSLTKASEKLHYGIPNISRQITSLEESLNIILFHRKGNKLSLTSQGEILFQKTGELLDTIDSIKDSLKEPTDKPEGLLRVYATEAIACLWLVPRLKGFLDKYPGIRLDIHGDDRKVDFVLRESDVVIGPSISNGPELIQAYLMTDKGGLYASKEYLEKFGTPMTPEDLDHHHLITRSGGEDLPCTLTDWSLSIGRGGNKPRTPYFSSNSLRTMATFALEGKGIAHLSSKILKHPQQDVLIPVLADIDAPSMDLFYTYRRSMKNSKRVECLRDYLLEQIAKEKALQALAPPPHR